ncbi:putative oxidoreductase [Nocardia tenerifensis]|uniref:Putative oxidoreductase n=1 Tax=Nocardia tenerifensis TaxID=228006 RepID=A0A318KBN0_9NOCA|nr:zinc-binding alcohol dehydrogenase family protein [Nocardia tenerifensis]PXX71526.1 putative oxidoreductase [Nocardia tenerifensis]
MSTTKAVRVFEHGGPEKLIYDDYPLEPLGPHSVLVAVHSASVSGWDLKYRSGQLSGVTLPGRRPLPMPQQLGREASGTVVAVGSAVTRFAPGENVVAVVHPENPYSPQTYRGLGNLSIGIDVPGHAGLGSYAQYLVRDERMWLPLPEHVDLEQAAVVLWPYATAHRLVRDRLRVRLGDTVLVCGASGGMGEATVHLARLAGARVAVTTRHADKTELLEQLGAELVVVTADHQAARERLREWTAGEGVDHVVDYTGDPDLFRLGVDSLRLGGKICPAAGNQRGGGSIPLTMNDFTRLEMTVVGIRGARHHDALTVLDLLARERIGIRIAARFPLSDAASAHTLLEDSTTLVGRVILQP